MKPEIRPPVYYDSVYGTPARQLRGVDLPDIMSLGVRDLFPDMTPEIYLYGDDLSAIRKATEKALTKVDMSMIRARDTVNIVTCEHGFSVQGGQPYAEMIKTIRDVVYERTGCENIRLRIGEWQGFKEADEVIRYFGFDHYFGKGKVTGFHPLDKGVAIETEVGTLYLIAKLFDADWFINAYYDDAREPEHHHYLTRPLKAFMMAYARQETRSLFHCFPPNTGVFLTKAVFDSLFVRRKYSFTCTLRSSPAGITGVDADNDVYALSQRIAMTNMRDYGKMHKLLSEIDECIAIIDGGRWPIYIPAGGTCFKSLRFTADAEIFDLDNLTNTSGYDLHQPRVASASDRQRIKALVLNQVWFGIPLVNPGIPTILVGREMADRYAQDPSSPFVMEQSVIAETLQTAVAFAKLITKTDNIIVFDGSFGVINLSPSLGKFLIEKAPEVSRKVEAELPKWLKQRGIDPAMV